MGAGTSCLLPSLPPPSPGEQSSLPASSIPPRGSGSCLVPFPSSRNPEARWFIMNSLYCFLNLSCLLSQIPKVKSSDSFSQFLNGDEHLHASFVITTVSPQQSPPPLFLVCLFVVVVVQFHPISLSPPTLEPLVYGGSFCPP